MPDKPDRPTLAVRRVEALDERRLAVVVDAEDDPYLQFVYRAGIGIHWNPSRRRFEDRLPASTSHVASFDRLRRAVAEELGIDLRAAADVDWVGLGDGVRAAIEPSLR